MPDGARSLDDACLAGALERAGVKVEDVRPMIPELTILAKARKAG